MKGECRDPSWKTRNGARSFLYLSRADADARVMDTTENKRRRREKKRASRLVVRILIERRAKSKVIKSCMYIYTRVDARRSREGACLVGRSICPFDPMPRSRERVTLIRSLLAWL